MSAAVRHQPSLDLQHKSSVESFYSIEESTIAKVLEPPARHSDRPKPSTLRLATSTPILQKRYQSDEEQPSPGMEEDFSSEDSVSSGEMSEIEIDDTIDLDDLEPIQVVTPTQLAKAVPIVFIGKPSLVSVSALAPMYKRSRPALGFRTPSSSSLHKAMVAVPIPPRSQHRRGGTGNNRSLSLYEPPVVVDHVPAPKFSTPTRPAFTSSANSSVTNFSAPMRNLNRPRPSPLTSYASIRSSSSSPPQLSESFSPISSVASSETDEADALIMESAEIQVRTRSTERERLLALGQGYFSDGESDETEEEEAKNGIELDESPTPTSYQAYDPFALDPPRLPEPLTAPSGRRGSATAAATSVAKKGWKGLVRGRVGRRGAIAT